MTMWPIRYIIIFLRNGYVSCSSPCSGFLHVSHRSRPANERGLNSESRTCLSDVPLSHVVAVPDCCSLRTGRVPRVEREIMVVTKSAAPDTLLDSVSASFLPSFTYS